METKEAEKVMVAFHHKVYLTNKDDHDRENQNSIFSF
ncbi:hypothetical protein BJQ97_00408 [Geobacillus sp. TFV-3]|nr:hypothetical protein BJQ97_00408 [Geobacillus sp. TFV-3]